MNQYEQRIYELEQQLAEARAAATTAAQRLATLADFLPEGVLLYNDDDKIVLINQQFCSLLGMTGPASDWLGKDSADIVPLVQTLVLESMAFVSWLRRARACSLPDLGKELLLRNGRTIQLDYVPIRSRGQEVGSSRLVCFRDVSERKATARQLDEQRTFYETILDFLPGEAAVYDVDHRYRYINAKAVADPAVRAWLIGKTDLEYAAHRNRDPEIAVRRRQLLDKALAESQVEWEEAMQLPDGTMRYMLRQLHAIRGEGNQPRMLIGYGTDITERHKTEELMRAQFAALPDTILVVDAAGRVPEAKLGDTPLLLPEAALKGAMLKQLLPPQVAQVELWPCLEQVRATGQPGACTFQLTDASGAASYHAARVVALPTAQVVLVILQNITSQELTRRQLAEQQEFVRQVIDTSPTLVSVRNEAGQVVFSNRSFEDFTQRIRHMAVIQGTAQAEQGSALSEEVARINHRHAYVLATGEDLSYETAFTLLDGKLRWLQSTKRPFVRSDSSRNVLSVSTDITDIKHARYELESSEKKYRDLVHYSLGLVCTHDLEGNLLAVNPAIERLLGKTGQEMVGRNLREVVPPEHLPRLQQYLDDFAQHTEQHGSMAFMTHKSGKRYLQYNNYRVKETGRLPYVVASAYDITESVLTERALRQAKREVEEIARAKDNFLATMSHEIRTPLNGVLGMAALLAKTNLDNQQRELLTTINQSGQHLLAVVNDVLDMAKITAGLLELEHSSFDLWASVQGAVQTVRYLAEENGLYLSVAPFPLPSPVVLGDSRRLNQVLLNLLANAIKFTEHGSVTLGGDLLDDTPETVSVRFWVRDTGIGIPLDMQQQIFGIFTQANTDTTRRFGGTGLGLAISQHLVQRMGGTLAVDSAPGQGSTFSFSLTFPRSSTVPARPTGTIKQPVLVGLRVLLAEDNRINQQIAVLMLQPHGVVVTCAHNGPEALAHFNAHLYDVVLMDIQMPGMSGTEVTRTMRRHPDPRRADTPIVALTANALRHDQQRYLAAGMNACLTKPFEERCLHETIISVLSGAQVVAPAVAVPALVSDEATALYDLAFLKTSADGNQQFMDRMLTVFLQETPATVTALQQAAAALDWADVRRLAHAIKPVVQLLRMARGVAAIRTLENPETPPAALNEAALALARQLQLVCEALQELSAPTTAPGPA